VLKESPAYITWRRLPSFRRTPVARQQGLDRMGSTNHPRSVYMKNFMTALATTLLLVGTVQGQPAPPAGCADVEVHNVRPQQGQLMLAAYAGADSFQKNPLTALRVPAGDGVMRLQVCGLVGSSISLLLFQDLDSDGKMGRNLMGIPTEPWGSSGTPAMMGPTWDNSRVALDGKTIVVKLSI
jgi:uncharacterized protein (DUF2141 family)